MTTNATTKPTRSTVRRGMLQGKKEADALNTLNNTCTAGAACTEVQNDPMSSKALSLLQSAVTNAQTSSTARDKLGTQFLSARRTARLDFITCQVALMQYQVAVGVLAKGNAAIINKAGLLSRDEKQPAAALDKVATVKSKPGKHQGEAIVTWSPGPGATSYAIEVNFTPQNPNGTWTALNSGSGRRRIVKGPTPGAQFLVRIASIGAMGPSPTGPLRSSRPPSDRPAHPDPGASPQGTRPGRSLVCHGVPERDDLPSVAEIEALAQNDVERLNLDPTRRPPQPGTVGPIAVVSSKLVLASPEGGPQHGPRTAVAARPAP